MKSGGGKRKGGIFENKIYDDIRAKDVWVRKNKGSGNTKDNAGDLETKEYLIECKHYKKITQKNLLEWAKKIEGEAQRIDKVPLLICKENNKDIVVYYWLYIDDKAHDLGISSISYDKWLNLCLYEVN